MFLGTNLEFGVTPVPTITKSASNLLPLDKETPVTYPSLFAWIFLTYYYNSNLIPLSSCKLFKPCPISFPKTLAKGTSATSTTVIFIC